MKKSNFVALILATAGGLCFSIGVCLALFPKLGLTVQGVVCGIIGLAVFLAALWIWRTLAAVFVGVLGALLLGVGVCLAIVSEQKVVGCVVAAVGILVLLMLIPLLKKSQPAE